MLYEDATIAEKGYGLNEFAHSGRSTFLENLRSDFTSHFMSIRIFLWYWSPVVLYAGLIVALSSMSAPQTHFPSWFEGVSDKIWHALEYAVLAILCHRAFLYGAGHQLSVYAVPLAIVAAILFGATDEIHQFFVPLREADGLDLLADATGAILGVKVWQGIAPQRRTIRVS